VLLAKCVLRYFSKGQEPSSLTGSRLSPDLNPHYLAETAILIILIDQW